MNSGGEVSGAARAPHPPTHAASTGAKSTSSSALNHSAISFFAFSTQHWPPERHGNRMVGVIEAVLKRVDSATGVMHVASGVLGLTNAVPQFSSPAMQALVLHAQAATCTASGVCRLGAPTALVLLDSAVP